MKTIKSLLVFLFAVHFSSAAFADKVTLVMVRGGMGTDGASLEPYPEKNSVVDSIAIYNALNVKPSHGGKKIVGIEHDGDVFGIECEQPAQGIHTETAGCLYMSILKEVPPKKGISIEIGSVELAPVLSQQIFEALEVDDDSRRVGAVVKQVGNLTCTKAVRPGVKAKCILADVTVSKIAIDQFPPEDHDELRKLAKKIGL